jgi:hypothetical protein
MCYRYGFLNTNNMKKEIKKLKQEVKEWQSQEVKQRFESVDSQLHIITIENLKHKIKKLKIGEDI